MCRSLPESEIFRLSNTHLLAADCGYDVIAWILNRIRNLDQIKHTFFSIKRTKTLMKQLNFLLGHTEFRWTLTYSTYFKIIYSHFINMKIWNYNSTTRKLPEPKMCLRFALNSTKFHVYLFLFVRHSKSKHSLIWMTGIWKRRGDI